MSKKLDAAGMEPVLCDTFHEDDHDQEDIHTHALFGCIFFEAKTTTPTAELKGE